MQMAFSTINLHEWFGLCGGFDCVSGVIIILKKKTAHFYWTVLFMNIFFDYSTAI